MQSGSVVQGLSEGELGQIPGGNPPFLFFFQQDTPSPLKGLAWPLSLDFGVSNTVWTFL